MVMVQAVAVLLRMGGGFLGLVAAALDHGADHLDPPEDNYVGFDIRLCDLTPSSSDGYFTRAARDRIRHAEENRS